MCFFVGAGAQVHIFHECFKGYGRVYEVYKVYMWGRGLPFTQMMIGKTSILFPLKKSKGVLRLPPPRTDWQSPFFEVWRMAEILPSVVSVVVYLLLRSFLWR